MSTVTPSPETPVTLTDKINAARKALAAFVVPALIVVVASLLPDSAGGEAITVAEWVQVAIAALGTSSAVYAITNK